MVWAGDVELMGKQHIRTTSNTIARTCVLLGYLRKFGLPIEHASNEVADVGKAVAK